MFLRVFIVLFILFSNNIFDQNNLFGQNSTIRIGLLKYKGGGDWYANPTSLPNLIKFANQHMKTNIPLQVMEVDINSSELFHCPFVHMTGHGNVVFTSQDVLNLRNYLSSGGFLHIDDNYGMDPFVRREMKKVFPELEFVEIPFDHPIYNNQYKFATGLPKIHEHDNKPPQGFGLFLNGRLVVFYTYECDLGDGWEDREVHNDSEETRTKALEMGCNILRFAFSQ